MSPQAHVSLFVTEDTKISLGNSFISLVRFADKLMDYKDDFQKREEFIKAMNYFQFIENNFEVEKKDNSYKELDRLIVMIKNIMIDASNWFELNFVED